MAVFLKMNLPGARLRRGIRRAGGPVAVGLLAATLGSCGLGIKAGSAVFPNDIEPTGSIVGQGTFLSGTVTGNVTIYLIEGGSYQVRLANFTSSSESAQQVVAVTSGSQSYAVPLQYYTGNKNYTLGAPVPSTFVSVRIHSTLKNTDYGNAAIQATQ